MTHPFRRYRHEHGFTLQQMADKLGCSKGQLSRFENGHAGVSTDLMRRIAEVTQGAVTPNDIILPDPAVQSSPAAASSALSD